jgi:prevent-host-death family protein
MTVTVTEFKVKCLRLINQVHKYGRPLTITKHGKPIAKLIAEHPSTQIQEVRKALAGSVKVHSGPFDPAVSEEEINGRQ